MENNDNHPVVSKGSDRLEFENAMDKFVNSLTNWGWSDASARKYVKRITIEYFKDREYAAKI
tara:strand:+ start:64 stop:249 length:186 start_codon:yes stop_codon:yes gene_type:complete